MRNLISFSVMALSLIGCGSGFETNMENLNLNLSSESEFGKIEFQGLPSNNELNVSLGGQATIIVLVSSSNEVASYVWEKLNSQSGNYDFAASSNGNRLNITNAGAMDSGTYHLCANIWNRLKTRTSIFCSSEVKIIVNNVTPSPPAPTATVTPRPTAVPTVTPRPTAVPTVTPRPTAVPTVTPRPTAVPTVTPRPTAAPTVTPTPTSPPVNGADTITINGSNFGVKPIAAPHRFFPLLDEADGTTSKQVHGIASDNSIIAMEQTNLPQDCPYSIVSASDAPWGKSLVVTKKVTEDNGGFTPAMGSFLPAKTNKVFASLWLKAEYTGSAPTRRLQLKQPRSGVFGSNPSDGNTNYQASGVKFHAEMYLGGNGIVQEFTPFFNNSNNQGFDYSNGARNELGNGDGSTLFRSGFNFWNKWHHIQVLYDAGTVGKSDGSMYWWWDGALVAKLSNRAVRLAGSNENPIQHLQYLTGFQNLSPNTYVLSTSRMYLDTTQARVELINAANYADATGFIILPPVSWSATKVVAKLSAKSIPIEYKWVAVTNENGVTQVFSR